MGSRLIVDCFILIKEDFILILGGDIQGGRGNGGESIYGETFADETFVVKHNQRGILGLYSFDDK